MEGNEVVAGRLRMRVLHPAEPVITFHDFHGAEPDEFGKGWRIDVSGSDTRYEVELSEK